MAKISDFRNDLIAELDALALQYGENTELTPEQTNIVSSKIDDVNETHNPNLPARPNG